MTDNLGKRKAFFLGTTKRPEEMNRAYSNFVYSLCLDLIKKNFAEIIDIDCFKRHDMFLGAQNIRHGVYQRITEADLLIILVDEYDKGFNPNVWFELGMAAPLEKAIVLVSQTRELPFYASDVSPVFVYPELMEWFNHHQDDFKNTENISLSGQTYNFDSETSSQFRTYKQYFDKSLSAQIDDFNNPFRHDIDAANIFTLGHGSIYQLIESIKSPTEFIEGERNAFNSLTEEIINAKKSVRTTRSANQSIVANENCLEENPDSENNDNGDVHIKFMEALCSSSHIPSMKTFDRIICNNNPKKWEDIKYFLSGCSDNARIFVRKNKFSLGYELVIIDERVSFIHFHNLSRPGDRNTDNSKNIPSYQVINSTLKIVDEKSSRKLAAIFDRFHHYDFDQPQPCDLSRTLIGIPASDDKEDDTPISKEYHNCGVLYSREILTKINPNDPTSRNKRDKEIDKYLYQKFIAWCDNMDFDDRCNMALGICYISPEVYGGKIIQSARTQFFKESNSSGISNAKIDKVISDMKSIVGSLAVEE